MRGRVRHDPLLGSVVHNYRIEALIGEGSAARVYQARHRFLDRRSALKLLTRTSVTTPGLLERFEREARALATISHPNVVSVFDFGLAPGGRPFLAMELLEGRTLAEVIEQEGSLEPWRIRRIARQLAAGLAEAHRHQIVHRDLKPANIMLLGRVPSETVKILDFGVARASGPSEKELTGHEVIIGTPRYMAPEQVMNPTSVSPASDLYSLGVVLYEMLSGQAPFEGAMMEVLDQQMNRAPPPLTTDTGLERIVDQLLSKRPEDRPPHADTLIRALDLMPDPPTRLDGIQFADRTSLMFVAGRALTVIPDATIDEATVPDERDPVGQDPPTRLRSRSLAARFACVVERERQDQRGAVEERLAVEAETLLQLAAERTRSEPRLPSLSFEPRGPSVGATRLVEVPAPRPATPRPVQRRGGMSKHDRIAAVLACIALVLGCSVVALAAVSVQRRLEPQVVVVPPGDPR